MPLAVQLATGTRLVLLVLQVVAIQLGAPVLPAVQVATGVGPLTAIGVQVVATQALPLPAVMGVQEATRVGPVLLGAQVVAIQPLPEVAAIGTQLDTPVGPVVVKGQVVVV